MRTELRRLSDMSVSVVVPLHGDEAYAERTRAAFAPLNLRDGGEIVFVS